MILQALVDYYEALVAKGKRIPPPGWEIVVVSYALEIDESGMLISVLPLKTPSPNGKKMIPRPMFLPERERNSSDTTACFLCDDRRYVLGIPESNEQKHIKKAQEAFEDSRTRYAKILAGTACKEATAISIFFESWETQKDRCREMIAQIEPKENIVFLINNRYAHEVKELRNAWNEYHWNTVYTTEKRCMVTGNIESICRIHPSFNIPGGTNPKIVSFDEESVSFCSYGKDGEQGLNVQIGNITASKYGNALKYLIQDAKHSFSVSGMKVVFWAEDANHVKEDIFEKILNPDNSVDDELLADVIPSILNGKGFNFDGVPCDPDNNFYILGLYASAKGRLGVRFFLFNSFGRLISNMKEHYDRLGIVFDNRNKRTYISPWALLHETVNQKSNDDPLPQMAGDMLRAILINGAYPETLYWRTIMRIMATQDDKDNNIFKITRGRAAIIKAHLIKNHKYKIEGELMEEEKNTAYILGRLFSVLEEIQDAASDSTINVTIKDSFFNTACLTPMYAFARLLQLKNHHIKVIERKSYGYAINLEKKVTKLVNMLNNPPFPSHQSIQEQGMFILGYYHQTQKRYEKKDKAESTVISEKIKEEK